jgi:nitrate/TMAO reductase-like tetraheme cytochrome c subunit
MTPPSSVLAWICLLCVAISGGILLRHLFKAPPLDLRTKLTLAFGLGLFPALAAATSTVVGIQRTTERDFCGSCHVMGAHVADAEDRASVSLAARHAQNPFFGEHNCYTCHADYSMIGYALTKLNGLKHVYHYYLSGYRQKTLEQALAEIRLYEPYDNGNCKQCHTGRGPLWRQVPEHLPLEAALDSNTVSCASAGCHGYAHPFSKPFQSATHDGGAVSRELSP